MQDKYISFFSILCLFYFLLKGILDKSIPNVIVFILLFFVLLVNYFLSITVLKLLNYKYKTYLFKEKFKELSVTNFPFTLIGIFKWIFPNNLIVLLTFILSYFKYSKKINNKNVLFTNGLYWIFLLLLITTFIAPIYFYANNENSLYDDNFKDLIYLYVINPFSSSIIGMVLGFAFFSLVYILNKKWILWQPKIYKYDNSIDEQKSKDLNYYF